MKGQATHLIRDRDGKYVAAFDEAMEGAGIETRKTAPACPDQNAFAERWVRSVREECLDRFVVFGEKHLAHLLKEYVEHHNEERPHQGKGKDNAPLPQAARPALWEAPQAGEVACKRRLGGALKSYSRAA